MTFIEIFKSSVVVNTYMYYFSENWIEKKMPRWATSSKGRMLLDFSEEER